MLQALVFEGWIESLSDGSAGILTLKGRPGGRMVKTLGYFLVVQQASSTNARFSVTVLNGADGEIYRIHSSALTNADPGATLPAGVQGDAASSPTLFDWIRPQISISDINQPGSQQRAYVKLYEIRKPF